MSPALRKAQKLARSKRNIFEQDWEIYVVCIDDIYFISWKLDFTEALRYAKSYSLSEAQAVAQRVIEIDNKVAKVMRVSYACVAVEMS